MDNKPEKINIISNVYTMPANMRKKQPASYGFFKLGKKLNQENKSLIFVNQDKNRVYYKTLDRKTGKTSYIKDILYIDLKKIGGKI